MAGARSHFLSSLVPVALTARYAAMLQCRLLPGTAMLLLAAGAFTFFIYRFSAFIYRENILQEKVFKVSRLTHKAD
jgi:hypothetical protein